MTLEHYPDVVRIHHQGIASGHSTFATRSLSWRQLRRDKIAGQKLVALDARGEVVGWVTLTPAFAREAYRGVAEVSIYVDSACQGQGVGRALMNAIITTSEGTGIWSLHSLIFPENAASIRLHESCGFRRVGVYQRIGQKLVGEDAGKWHDVYIYERRSTEVGLDQQF